MPSCLISLCAEGRAPQIEQSVNEGVDVALIANAVVRHGRSLGPHTYRQESSGLIQSEDVFVRLIVTDVNGSVATKLIALSLQREPLVRSTVGEDVHNLFSTDHTHIPESRTSHED